MDYFLKELNIKRAVLPTHRSGRSIQKTPSIDSGLRVEADRGTKGANLRGRVLAPQDNRSVSELSGRFGSFELRHSRRNTLINVGLTNDSPIGDVMNFKKTNKVRLPRLEGQESELVSSEPAVGMLEPNTERRTPTYANGVTIELVKKLKLQPVMHEKVKHSFKTKAGSSGNRAKINQDSIVIDTKLPYGIKIFCVCDGHGLNGHLVSGFIRTQLISTCFIKTYKRKSKQAYKTDDRTTRG